MTKTPAKVARRSMGITIVAGIGVFVVWQLSLLQLQSVATFFQLQNLSQGAAREAALALLVMVGGFAPAYLALIAWRHWGEKRPVLSLFTAKPHFRWGLTLAAGGAMIALSFVCSALVDSDSLDPFSERLAVFSLRDWLMLALAYGVGAAVQASFEEVFVRGWLLQHIAPMFGHAFWAVLITSLVFCALHYGAPGWFTYVLTFAMGLAFGYSVVRLKGLEAAIGAHVGNNFVSALFVGAMVSGNPETISVQEGLAYGLYLVGFLGFVEVWARLLPSGRNP
jgi:membrane protease YdiL (CAAX protease family)